MITTPIDAMGRINEGALRKLAIHLIDGGVHGLFPVGSQGEFFSLTFEQKKEAIQICPVWAADTFIKSREEGKKRGILRYIDIG